MKPHNPKLEVRQKPCEEATPWETLGVLPGTSLGRCTAVMQAKGHVTGCLGGMTAEGTWPQEHWERQLPLSLQSNAQQLPLLPSAAGSTPTCFLHPLIAF